MAKELLVGGNEVASLCSATTGQNEVVLEVAVQRAELLGIVEVRDICRYGRCHLALADWPLPYSRQRGDAPHTQCRDRAVSAVV